MDLLDWHRGTLSSRRLAVLVRHLPADSAFARVREGESAEWSTTDHLLAAVVDHLAIGNWMYASVNRDEDTPAPDPPVPVPRPGAPADEPLGPSYRSRPDGTPTAIELARFFA